MPLTLQEMKLRAEREARAPPAVLRRRDRRVATNVASVSKLPRWTTRRRRAAFALACLAWLASCAWFVSSRASASASATSIPRGVRPARGADHRAASTAPRGIPRRARLNPNANPNPNPEDEDDDDDVDSSDDDIRAIRDALRASDEALRAVRDRPRAVLAPSRDTPHDATLASARSEPRPRGPPSSSRARTETVNANANDPDPDPAAADAASFAASPPSEPWLTVGIPTAPRAGDEDYLTGTLETLLAELPAAPSGVRVLVMNTAPGRHEVYARVKARFTGTGTGTGTGTSVAGGNANAWGLPEDSAAGSGAGEVDGERSAARSEVAESRLLAAAAAHVVFADSPGTYGDPTPNKPDPDDLHNPGNVPGHAVRRQTADLATLVDLASRETSPYFLFAEDDFLTCRGMFAGLRYLLAKSHAVYPTWLGVRFSYGMNGVVMRTRDLAPFARYLATHVSRQPPDILWREWSEGRREDVRAKTAGRRVLVYRYNLMEHVGEVSTFAVRPGRPKWPRCYDPMSEVWSLGAAEKFDDARCASQDVSPCLPGYGVHVDRWNGDTPDAAEFPWLATRRSPTEA
jgi:hypothetical protein